MATKTLLAKNQLTKDWIKKFEDIAPRYHRINVFHDFITMSAIAIHNATYKIESLEQEYLSLASRYDKEELQEISVLLGMLIELMGEEPTDTLGELFMSLDFGNSNLGQFFTPFCISELTARVNYNPELENKPIIKILEPSCGSGGMMMAMIKIMRERKFDYHNRAFFSCIDIDRNAALMCFLQLSLWGVPAEVIIGDTLNLKFREVWHTPIYHLNFWSSKLRNQSAVNLGEDEQSEIIANIVKSNEARELDAIQRRKLADYHRNF